MNTENNLRFTGAKPLSSKLSLKIRMVIGLTSSAHLARMCKVSRNMAARWMRGDAPIGAKHRDIIVKHLAQFGVSIPDKYL